MFKRERNDYGKVPAPETPYQKAAQVWDDRIGSARVQAKNWRLMALSFGLVSLTLAGGLIWQGSSSIVTPYVVEISETGRTRTIAPATENYRPEDEQIAWHLAGFITNVRSVSIDPVVVRENWLEAYDYATDQGAALLNEYARENDPFADIGERSRTVEIISVVRSSKDSFDLRWQETTYRNGRLERKERHTGNLTFVIDQPRTVDRLRKNPLGIYVHGINWSKELEPGGGS